ncbi:MAG: DUF2490 domain-containing protein [Paludibacteraceae bacterium]
MNKRHILLFFLPLMCLTLIAQSQYGTWTSFAIDKKVHKWNFQAETELRTIYYARLINRWSLGIDAEYKIVKPIGVVFGYQFMNVLDQKYLNYQFRNRFTADIFGKQKWGNFSFSLTEGLQLTTKNDNKRIKKDLTIDTYKVNNAWMWKNGIEVEYNIPKCKITPEFDFKSYYTLNEPDGNVFDKLRYTLSLKYKLNKHNFINVFGVYNHELGEDDADYSGKYILGVKYTIHL